MQMDQHANLLESELRTVLSCLVTLATGKACHLIGINNMIKKPWGEYPIARYMGRLN